MSDVPRDPKRRATVIGLGNPLMADDGLGVLALQQLREDWDLPDTVETIDGGTWGMKLLPAIEDADELLLVDAINLDMPPGTDIELERHEIPRVFALKISPHQIDVAEVLALCELRDTLPERMVAIGLQPERIEFGAALSPRVEERMDSLVANVVYQLELWGHRCVPRVRNAHA
ncbi:MAG: HyaD/HybD family hydrogenase maturation endopeptidase [Gemmatimonadota bacterium]